MFVVCLPPTILTRTTREDEIHVSVIALFSRSLTPPSRLPRSSIYYFDPSNVSPIAMKMTHHGHMGRHYPPPFMTGPGGGGGMGVGGGGGGGYPPSGGRRKTERNKAEENVPMSREKSSSNTGSIDVIPEDQFHGSCTPTEANVAANNVVPSDKGSHYTKGGESRVDCEARK